MQNTLPESIKERISKEAEKEIELSKQAIKDAGENPNEFRQYYEGFGEGYEAALTAAISNPGQWNLAVADWIPVENRLPAKFKNVLGLSKLGKIAITCVDSSGELDQFELEVDFNDCWTHWTSIPPKPGESTPSTDTAGLVDKEGVKALFAAYCVYRNEEGDLEFSEWLDSNPIETLNSH